MSTTDDSAVEQLAAAGLVGSEVQSDDGFLPYDPKVQQAFDIEKGMASPELLALLDQAERDITAWIPGGVGESLMGTVIDYQWVEGGEYDPYWMIVVQTPSGAMMGFHAYHFIINKNVTQKIESGELCKGTLIALSYRGEGKANGAKNPPKLYNMRLLSPQV